MKYQGCPNIPLMLAILFVLALPESGWTQFTFTTNNGAITITGYTGAGGNVVIPSSTNGYPVLAIAPTAFRAKYAITSVTIPDSVTSIGHAAFQYCAGLTNLVIGNSVTSIGDYAFDQCTGLKSVTIPNSVTSIPDSAFYYCSGLMNVLIGNSVTNIDQSAFYYCSSLESFAVDVNNTNYASAGGVLFNKPLTTLIQCPYALTGSYVIPNSVTSIGYDAFAACTGLNSVTIPNSVTNIGGYAFAGCSGLTNVTIPNSVTSIGYVAFAGCSGLKSVTIPNSVTSIGGDAFGYCSGLTSLTIPNSVTSIGRYAFEQCYSLHSAYFQGNAPSVNGGAGSADTTLFQGESGTVYYVPGTTGWGATFGGWPTAWWYLYQPKPQILGSGYGLGVQSNRFQFTTFWATNTSVVVEARTNLSVGTWIPLQTNALISGTNYFSDSKWTNYPRRFYRVRSQ